MNSRKREKLKLKETEKFKEILKNTLPLLENGNSFFREKYMEIAENDDMIIDFIKSEKDFFNPEKMYKLFLKFYFKNSILPDSLKFVKIFYHASQNTFLKDCIKELKDEVDEMNGYFMSDLIEDIKNIRSNLDIASFVIMNFGYDKVKKAYEENKIIDFLSKMENWKIKVDFKKVKEWIEQYNTKGKEHEAYETLINYLDVISYNEELSKEQQQNNPTNKKISKEIDDNDIPF